MRGAERPAKVQWTRPFLPPLNRLSDDAAHQTFLAIADDVHDSKEVCQILSLTDNLRLAVDLIAHLVDLEGCANVLARWETEKADLLSDGFNQRSNLDASIRVSLLSPRIMALPNVLNLLSLLSILPDGLSDAELLGASLPIQDPQTCRAVLLTGKTSLAYNDDKKQLKLLVPLGSISSISILLLLQALRNHFAALLYL